MIQQYYRYDMTGLKTEIRKIFDKETKMVEEERHAKLKEIENKFRTLHKLSAEHISRGTRHKGTGSDDRDQAVDEKLLQDFERYSEVYEDQVKKANKEKQALREEIFKTEKEIREMRDLLAIQETENKNLQFLLAREAELAREKTDKEDKALRLLHDDLNYQLNAIENQNSKTGDMVTSSKMEERL